MLYTTGPWLLSSLVRDPGAGSLATRLKKVKAGNNKILISIGRFQSIKTGVLLIFSFITGDKTEFLSPMIISNEYITGM